MEETKSPSNLKPIEETKNPSHEPPLEESKKPQQESLMPSNNSGFLTQAQKVGID